MKIIRLGNTETHLLFAYFMVTHTDAENYIKQYFHDQFIDAAKWLYTCCGYYDKNISLNFPEAAYNPNFIKYVNDLEIVVENCYETQFYFQPEPYSIFKKYQYDFYLKYFIKNFKLLNETRFCDRIHSIYNFIKNKNVLVISSFDGLIMQQYNSNNVYKIYPDFPILKSLKTIKFPYCFNNNGPHNNYFETLEYIFSLIKNTEFDIAILSCGSYGHMLTHRIDLELNKDAIYIGGNIQEMFGILCKREKDAGFIKPNEYWITTIPEEYIPSDYKTIEDGCYW